MTLEEIRRLREQMGFTYQQMSELSGVPLGTVQKILSGQTRSPRYETLRALERVFPGMGSDRVSESPGSYEVPDPVSGWSRQGTYTLKDYYALPDEQRVELIDGRFYDMAAPSGIHQLLIGMIYAQLLAHCGDSGLDCEPIISAIDVQPDCDEKTMVQPDVIVLCDLLKFRNRCIFGAPDPAIEILSESTKKKDTGLKLMKYQNAGVREYWTIYPDLRKIVVYDFENELPPAIYTETDTVPVTISGGKCSVDFAPIFSRIDRIEKAAGIKE